MILGFHLVMSKENDHFIFTAVIGLAFRVSMQGKGSIKNCTINQRKLFLMLSLWCIILTMLKTKRRLNF